MITQSKMLEDLLHEARFFALKDGFNDTPLPDVWVYRESEVSTRCAPKFSRPLVGLTLQGVKRLVVAGVSHAIKSDSIIIHSTCLPTECYIEEADSNRPFLSIVTTLDRTLIADLLLRAEKSPAELKGATAPVMLGNVDDLAIAAFWQMMNLARTPQNIPIMMPAVKEALHASLLCGPFGNWLAALQTEDTYSNRMIKVIAIMQEQFDSNICIESLAKHIAMSPASFYRHFKLFTGCSPNQYIKKLRLHKARQLLLSTSNSVESVACAVGYKSCSQFCADFKRRYNDNATNFRTARA